MRPNRTIPSFLTLPNQREFAFSHSHPSWLPSVTDNCPGAPGAFPAWPFHLLVHTVTMSCVASSDLCVPVLILHQFCIRCVQLLQTYSVVLLSSAALQKWWLPWQWCWTAARRASWGLPLAGPVLTVAGHCWYVYAAAGLNKARKLPVSKVSIYLCFRLCFELYSVNI